MECIIISYVNGNYVFITLRKFHAIKDLKTFGFFRLLGIILILFIYYYFHDFGESKSTAAAVKSGYLSSVQIFIMGRY